MLLLLAISFRLDWSCTFTILSICLSIVYGLCFLLCLVYQLRLLRLPCHKRQSQRLFLHLCVGQCLLRALYFVLWPILVANNPSPGQQQGSAGGGCVLSVEGEGEGIVLMVIGSLPSALFLSAFTINVFTFSRIYHTTLNHSVLKYRLVLLLMATVNLATYSTLVLLYIVTTIYTPQPSAPNPADSASADRSLADVAESLYLYALSCSTLIVAASFCFYGIKLYLGLRGAATASLRSPPLHPSGSFSSVESIGPTPGRSFPPSLSAPFLTPSSSLSSTTAGGGAAGGWSCWPAYNPMLKLAVVSTLTMLCFLVRVVLLPLLSHYQRGQFSFSLLLLYVTLSEVVPLLLVLYLFDPVREGKGMIVSRGVKPGESYDDAGEEEWVIDGEDDGDRTAWDDEPRSARPPLLQGMVVGSVGDGGMGGGSMLGGEGFASSLGGMSVGSRGDMTTLSPRELDRRRVRMGTSYEAAFKADLKSLIADD